MIACPVCGSPVVSEIDEGTYQCMECGYAFDVEEADSY